MSERVEQILDVAERRARTGGYGGFSFREIAKEVGIKAASVHYHFPEKEALGAALARRYTDRFIAALGDPNDPQSDPVTLKRRFVDAYRRSLVEDGLMCLCGMFGAEISDLPPRVQDETRQFFVRNFDWLRTVLIRESGSGEGPGEAPGEKTDVTATAYRILAALEGALLLARSLDDVSVFDAVTADLTGIP